MFRLSLFGLYCFLFVFFYPFELNGTFVWSYQNPYELGVNVHNKTYFVLGTLFQYVPGE